MRSIQIRTITFKLEGADEEQTERCRSIIHRLLELGFFNIRRGKAIVSFDHLGNMGSYHIEVKKWEREDDKRPSKVEQLLESVKVISK